MIVLYWFNHESFKVNVSQPAQHWYDFSDDMKNKGNLREAKHAMLVFVKDFLQEKQDVVELYRYSYLEVSSLFDQVIDHLLTHEKSSHKPLKKIA